jgi:peroxiredoxin/mono/diheme cytochrome c family protein
MAGLWLLWMACATAAEMPAGARIGESVGASRIGGADGPSRRLDEWEAGKPLVVAFVGAGCPLAELYAGRLAGLAGAYGARGVAFVGLAPNGRDSADEVARFAREHRLPFPALPDPGGAAATRLGATRTPSVVVLDARRAVRYRGRIDDQYSLGSRRDAPGRRDLAEALDALLAGRDISRPETEAVGCPIEWPEADPAVAYHRDVAPILRKRCVSCHGRGRVAPFALTTYRQASGRASAIAEAVEDRRMPPWGADPAFGTFANDAHLTDREVRTLADWARGGRVEGEPAPGEEAETPPGDAGGWSIPGPDLVAAMPETFAVPAEGVVEYQQFEVDPGSAKDRWVVAAELRPGAPSVVHHCTVCLRAPGSADLEATPGAIESFCLLPWAPGTSPLVLPPGMAKRIPAGWRLVFFVHYAPDGRPRRDRTRLGLTFATPGAVRREVATHLVHAPDLSIPPRAADYRVERTWRVPADALPLGMFPHMHLRGKSFRFEAGYPGGGGETLLSVPRYDFNWQTRYELATPKRIPAGTTIRCIATYDNSPANPANPDPAATVRAGPQGRDEMFNGYLDVAIDLRDPARRAAPSPLAQATFPGLLAVLAACGLALRLDRRRGRA